MDRLKILLVGHAFWPGEGSEPGFTWNWAWHLSEYHDVWVIAHPLHRAAVEAALAGHSVRVPRVVWVDVPRKPEQGERGIRLHYLRWQRAALAQARRLHAAQKFDIVHHVSWGTINSPPALWRLGAPFVWGPVGGGQAAPLRFARYSGLARHARGGRAARSSASAAVPPAAAARSGEQRPHPRHQSARPRKSSTGPGHARSNCSSTMAFSRMQLSPRDRASGRRSPRTRVGGPAGGAQGAAAGIGSDGACVGCAGAIDNRRRRTVAVGLRAPGGGHGT